MRKEIVASRIARVAVCLILFGSTTGCTTLVPLGLGAAGVETHKGRPSPGAPLEQRRPRAGVRGTYRHAPLDWAERSQARPYSIATGLFRSPAFDGGCHPIPIGLQQLMRIPNGATAATLERIGPIEIGVQGPVAHLFEPGYFDRLRDGELFYAAPALADYGLKCGFQSNLYVRVSTTETTPIAVHR